MATERIGFGLAAGAIVLAGLAVAALLPRFTHTQTLPDIGGPFALVGGDGHAVTDEDFRGRWRLIYFGYTHCPDACPTTLTDIGAALDKLPDADRKRIAVLFITVDPARDTPAVVGAYARAFGPEFVGLTGSEAALAPVETLFHVYAKRHALKGGDYAMDHSSIVYVMNPQGRFVGLVDDALSPADMAKRLTQMGV
jgi:protein SCO1/2